jgi:hypothetical protein
MRSRFRALEGLILERTAIYSNKEDHDSTDHGWYLLQDDPWWLISNRLWGTCNNHRPGLETVVAGQTNGFSPLGAAGTRTANQS